ncbi:MAG TPA: hypothetical protein VJV74_09785 [Terriglobia bacterium]|nr:hypothetical protein [Terriglobia bacterium]
MIALRLVRLIETHSLEIASEIVRRIQTSPRTSDLRTIPELELRVQAEEFVRDLGQWSAAQPNVEVEVRYRELGARRAMQSISPADACWALVLAKEYLTEFLRKHAFVRGPAELYGEMELLWLLDQFFNSALCSLMEGYALAREVPAAERREREVNLAEWVP